MAGNESLKQRKIEHKRPIYYLMKKASIYFNEKQTYMREKRKKYYWNVYESRDVDRSGTGLNRTATERTENWIWEIIGTENRTKFYK